MIRSILLAAAFASSLSVAQLAMAQTTVATDPVGFTTLTVNAKPADKRGFTLLSLNMTRPTVFQGLVPSGGASTANNATTLTFAANSFTANQFAPAPNGASHYVEVANGPKAGLVSDIQSATTSSITLADDISAAVTAGSTTIKIRPLWTLAAAFGANNSAGLLGASSSSQADTIQVFDAASGAFISYFYSTLNNRWQKGAADASNEVIPPDAGLRIERKAGTSVNFTLAGAVKLGPTGLFVQGGSVPANPQNSNYLPNPYPLDTVTLANSGLYTANAATGVQGASTSSQADTVSFYDTASGVFTNYYYNTANNRWQIGAADASNVVIPAGAAVLIKRKNTNGSFVWHMPPPAMNL